MLDLRKLLDGTEPSLTFEYTKDLDSFSDDIVSGRALAKGRIDNHSGYISLIGNITVACRAVCARCCKEFDYKSVIPVSAKLAEKLENADEDEDEFIIIKDNMFDIDEFVESTLLLEKPTRFLCREDCKGLCPICGCDLNKASCSCRSEDRDSRWDVLKDYFE